MRRPFFSLLFFTFLMVGLVLLLFLVDGRRLPFTKPSSEEAENFLTSFKKSHRPQMEINFSNLYGGGRRFEVLHPLLDLKTLRLKIPSSMCAEPEFAHSKPVVKNESCQIEQADYEPNVKRIKIDQALKEGIEVPQDLLATSPFVDDQGSSYAYGLFKSGSSPYNQKKWLQQNLSLFKVSELREVLDFAKIDNPEFSAVAEFSENEIKDFIEGSPLVLTKNSLMVKNQSRLGFSPLSYWVYDIRELRLALKDQSFDLVPVSSEAYCFQQVGDVCWTYNAKTALAAVGRYAVVIVVLVGLILFLLLSFYLRDLYKKEKEQESHRLSLQVLSHEFRTPVSALLLMMDRLSKKTEGWTDEEVDLLTRSSSEVFRLQRIVEMSKNYLQVRKKNSEFRAVEIPSINSWVIDFAFETDPRIRCELLPQDRSIFIDVFWLRFILKNLVENAFAHGMEPVILRLHESKGRFCVTVLDHGVCEFDSLKRMSEPFVKRSRSAGMGLGLNITRALCEKGGGQITFQKNPTSFTLALNQKEKNAGNTWLKF